LVFTPELNANSESWEISRTGSGLNYAFKDRILKDVLFIGNDGSVGIGTTTPSATLDINGDLSANSATISGALTANLLSAPNIQISELVCAKEIRVALPGTGCWPDYVFKKDYKLTPLNELEQFITQNQHLPNVPSAAEVEENGILLGEMNAILLQKVEELTLYILDLQKQITELKKQ
jgi:hypothetical protein